MNPQRTSDRQVNQNRPVEVVAHQCELRSLKCQTVCCLGFQLKTE